MATDVNIKNSTYNTKNGRYVLGGTTEVSSFAVEWWSMSDVARDPTDIVYFMEKKYEGRPELLGYVFYGDVGLWWIIGQFNGIVEPNEELIEGKILIIPTLERIQRAYVTHTRGAGGTPSTR